MIRTPLPSCPPGAARSSAWPPRGDDGVLLVDLLQELSSLLALLAERVGTGDWLDAFLLSAAADQILEDALSGRRCMGGRAWWRRVGRQLERGKHLHGIVACVRMGLAVADRLHEWTPSARRAIATHQLLSALSGSLAEAYLDPASVTASQHRDLQNRAIAALDRRGALLDKVLLQLMRLPSSFRSFDQQPADIVELVRRFSLRWPRRATPLVVVGVRTSGSYLAPLAAAALRGQGYSNVEAVTVRPRTTPGPRERRLLAEVAAGAGLVLVLDDPPVSGHSVRAVADQFERQGVDAERIVLLLALQEADHLPDVLRGYPAIVLPWGQWNVQRLLEPDAVAAALTPMLPSFWQVAAVRRRGPASPARRKHVQALYEAEITDIDTGAVVTLDLAVEGSGLGFFGRHSLAVTAALPDDVPKAYGFADGLVYHQSEGQPGVRPSMADPAVCADIGSYVARRHQALAVDRDRSLDVAGDQPVWEVAAGILGKAFGRPGTVLGPFTVNPLARRLLRVGRPSIVDGSMGPESWCRLGSTRLIKTDFAAAAFSNLDLSCYDPVFDLAGAAVAIEEGGGTPAGVAALRQQFEQASKSVVDEERWLLYQLVHLWNAKRTERRPARDTEMASARAVQRYLAHVYLADLPDVDDGPLCAVDLDGVLESSPLGFSATTMAGALALRSLLAHGYRPVLATGRSLGEVVDRCEAFGLAGGVAEYGAAIYDHRHGCSSLLISPEWADAVARLRACLVPRQDLEVDVGYRHIVRVRRSTGGGLRFVPPAELAELAALAEPPTGGSWHFVVGEGQTDILPPDIDKGRGLQALAARLQPDADPSAPALALAVGDTEADLPMLRLARLPFAPTNAHARLRQSGVPIVRSAHQKGLAEAVGHLLGHEPGQCSLCRPRAMTANRRLLVQLLSVQEAGGRGMPMRVARLAWKLGTQAVWR